jgi:hypothetical protein
MNFFSKKIEALMKQRKRAGLVCDLDEIVNKKVEHIEMKDHMITISDIDTLNKIPPIESEPDEEEDQQKPEAKNGLKKNLKRKLSDKITRLEKHLISSQGPSKKSKKTKPVRSNKASKKFYVKEKKCKKKADRKLKKKIIKYGERE